MNAAGCARGHSPDRKSTATGRCLECKALRKRARKAGTPPPPPADAYEVEVLEELPPEGGERWPRPTVQAPAVHTSRTRGEAYLVISDCQIPFEAQGALAFCLSVAREYNVPSENIYHVGDEVDFYHGSRFPLSPDAGLTPTGELAVMRERLQAWYRAFPQMRLCVSNHGQRWLKKAAAAQIPSQLLRAHRDMLNAPEGWEWRDSWTVRASRQPFRVEHGHMGAQGIMAHRQKAIDNGISTVHGHLHASAGIAYVNTHGQRVYGMNVGSLIDVEQIAFEYGRASRFQPWLGVGVILDGGRTPVLVPYG